MSVNESLLHTLTPLVLRAAEYLRSQGKRVPNFAPRAAQPPVGDQETLRQQLARLAKLVAQKDKEAATPRTEEV